MICYSKRKSKINSVGKFRIVVVNLWHACCSRLLVTVEHLERLTISGLEGNSLRFSRVRTCLSFQQHIWRRHEMLPTREVLGTHWVWVSIGSGSHRHPVPSQNCTYPDRKQVCAQQYHLCTPLSTRNQPHGFSKSGSPGPFHLFNFHSQVQLC